MDKPKPMMEIISAETYAKLRAISSRITELKCQMWKTRLLKSTIFTLEDVTYITDRSGTIYFCADDPEALDIQVTLLDVADKEWYERHSRLVTPMLETPDTSYPSGLEQQEGETKEEWENRIFGEDTDD